MKARVFLYALAVAGLASSAQARPDLTPIPISPISITAVPINDENAVNCPGVYLNETTQTGYFNAAGFEVADDLHTGSWFPATLCAFDIGYGVSTPADEAHSRAVVTIYLGDAGDSGPGAIIAGPYDMAVPMEVGSHAIHVEVASGIIGPDVWMGVRFLHATAGLLTMNPPSVGSSHDLDALSGVVSSSPYDGNPSANYYLGLYGSPPLGTKISTWGEVKSIYR